MSGIKNGILNTVQVKSTSCKTKYGIYQVALKSCGGTKGKTYKTLINTRFTKSIEWKFLSYKSFM